MPVETVNAANVGSGTAASGGSGKGAMGTIAPPQAITTTRQDVPHPMTGYTGTAAEPLANQQLIALINSRAKSQFGNIPTATYAPTSGSILDPQTTQMTMYQELVKRQQEQKAAADAAAAAAEAARNAAAQGNNPNVGYKLAPNYAESWYW